MERQVAHWSAAASRLSLDELAAPEAWRRLEQYLGLSLRAHLQGVIDRVHQSAEALTAVSRAAETPSELAELRRRLLAFRRQYLRAETTLDYFADAIATRTNVQSAALLRACDSLAYRAMAQVLDPLGSASPVVLSYIDKGLGASILKAGLRLWDAGAASPVAAIKITRHNLLRPTALIHEAGHQVAHITGWNQELALTLSQGLAPTSSELAAVWSAWASEIAADAIAFAHTGFASVAALHDVLAGETSAVFRHTPTDPHPVSYLRVLLGVETCRYFYGPGPVASLIATLKEKDKDKALTLYVIVFPGEARDNTGIKDLNDKVLGPEINNRYILRRQRTINELYGGDDTFAVVGQDYKTASVLTFRTSREEFARRLATLDATLRRVLLDEILPAAEKDALARNNTERLNEIRKLRNTLRKGEKYKFDIYFGVTAIAPMASRHSALETVYLLVTEASKAAGVAKLIAKGSSVTTTVAGGFTKGMKPDAKNLDPRGKQFDSKAYLLASTKAGDIKALMTRRPSRDRPDDYYNILIDAVWTVAFLKYRRWFVGHPDVIRDVRKKALRRPGKKYGLKYKKWFTAQKEMLELWLVLLNMIDYVKDFLSAEFRTVLARYHQDALIAYSGVVDPPLRPIDWPRLERVLTHDLRQTKRIAVLGTASEFQFYSYAADHPERIFFMLDIRDLGVALALLYENTTEDVEHRKLTGVKLMEETFKSTDWINRRKRLTYDRVVEVFKQYYDAVSQRRGLLVGQRAGRVSLGATIRQSVPSFGQSIQVMVGGDEVFVAAHPFYAGVVHRIIGDLAKTPLGEGTLNLRAAVAFSRAEGDPPKRDNVQAAHARAMMLAGLAPDGLKVLERSHRRIERLIAKLEANPKKKESAPKFRSDLDSLGLLRLFARPAPKGSMALTPQRYARLFRLLKAADIVGAQKTGDFELVDFGGQVVDAEKLVGDVKRLEDTVRKKVGLDNIHFDPPPVTQIPKWIEDLLDWIFKDKDKK
jgi:hypothetical protein